jgi:general secretion pathway protein M
VRDAWGSLSTSERQLALFGAAIVGVVLAWLLLWLPLDNAVQRLRTATPEAQAQLAKMRAQAAMIQPLRARTRGAPAPGAAVSVIDQSATSLGIRKQITRLESDGAKGVQITAEAVSFNSLIAWLNDLRDAYGLQVDNAQIDAHTVAGTVNARVHLRVENP